jgi:excisionase family DNA binding protein
MDERRPGSAVSPVPGEETRPARHSAHAVAEIADRGPGCTSASPSAAQAALDGASYVGRIAELLGFGLYKTKTLIATGELRSLRDGKYHRILPEWVDEYVARRVQENVR